MTISVPMTLLLFLSMLGAVTLSYVLYIVVINLNSLIKFKKPHRDIKDYKLFLLEEEIERLNKKIQTLEQENQQITYSFINNMKGG